MLCIRHMWKELERKLMHNLIDGMDKGGEKGVNASWLRGRDIVGLEDILFRDR